MAENTRPSSSLPPAMSSKQRRTSRQPMANLEDSTNRTQLISPPPEETLNHLRRVSRTGPFTPQISNSKRKRNISQGTSQTTEGNQIETTPNPKPRKQLKNRLSFLESPTKTSRNTPGRSTSVNPKSPHAENPDADWLPPIPSSASRRETISARARKTTPIPAYEPPADVFTPPKEVMLVPTISKSSKRKTPANRGRTSVTPCLTITIKKELPPIDLSAPMPPASPSDDPLLLSGPPEMSTPIRPRTRNLPSFADSPPQSPLPPSSEPDDDDEMEQVTERFDWTKHTVPEGSTDDMSMEVDEQDRDVPPIPLFDLNYAGPADNSTGWDSSDEEDDELPVHNGGFFEEGEGEYTGRWRQTRIPTKADPPSSATRDRMEEWGRPITPFPREKIKRLSLVKEAAAEEDRGPADENGAVAQEGQARRLPSHEDREDEEEEEEREVREMSLPLNDEDEQLEEPRTATAFTTVSPPRVIDTRFDFDQSLDDEELEPAQFEPEVPSPVVPAIDARFNFDQSFEDSVEAEVPDIVHDELSLPHDDAATAGDASLSTTLALDEQHSLQKSPKIQQEATKSVEEYEDEEEEREVHDLSVDFRGEEDEEEITGSATQSILDGLDGARSPMPQPPTIQSTLPSGLRHLSPAAVQTQEHLQSPASERESLSPEGRFTQETYTSPELISTSGNIPSRSAPIADVRHQDDIAVESDLEEGDSDSEDDSYDLGIVKITSADPRAAARAAAILKQHDYDCFTKIMMKQRKRSFTPGKAPSRRNSVIGGGIVKQSNISEIEKLKKCRATMGVIGETAYIPGSPAKTLPQLLQEAEAEVSVMHSPRGAPSLLEERNPLETPFSVQRSSTSFLELTPTHVQGRCTASGKREWSKEEWKLLDACFTDERLEVGEGDVLASVDEVQLVDVVARFVGVMGGDKVILSYGDDWNRESLLHRAATLQAKQRSGKIAPPTTPFATPALPSSHLEKQTTPEPAATPLSRRGLLPLKSKSNGCLDFPVAPNDGGLFANLASEPEEGSRRKMPLSLLAPRYSHLLQEAIEINQSTAPSSSIVPDSVDQFEEDEDVMEDVDVDTRLDDTSDPHTATRGSENIGKRVKGFITSYLPTLKDLSRSSKHRSTIPHQPGLPLPPKDLQGKTRGPITTPARPAPQKPKHPKDIVHLQPPPPLEKTVAPVTTRPKRLVDLQPVPAPEAPKPLAAAPRPRRSSGASVKDLVKSFEEKEKEAREINGKGVALKLERNIDGWRNKVSTVGQLRKPTWRP